MKLAIKNTKNTEVGNLNTPAQFSEEYRPDLIKRAVLSLQSRARQAYGSDPRAGLEHSANISRRRRHYRGSYGQGISRVPRKVHSRSGTRFNWVGAIMPGTRGGRRAHPPKSWKIWAQKINVKENRKAIRSALGATLDVSIVEARGHKVPAGYPFAISSEFEKLSKTSDVFQALNAIGLTEDLARAKPTKIRAGLGKMRGRKTRRATSALLVFSNDCPALMAANNIPGVEAVSVSELNAEILAPGTHAGRLTLYSDEALKKIESEKLFTNDRLKPVVEEKPKRVTTRAVKRAARKNVAKSTKKVTKKIAKEAEE